MQKFSLLWESLEKKSKLRKTILQMKKKAQGIFKMWQQQFLGTKKVKSAMLDIISCGGQTKAA